MPKSPSTEHMPGPTRGLCELTLEAHDPACLADFYRRVFGWDEVSTQPDRIGLACGDRSRLGLWTNGRRSSATRVDAMCTSPFLCIPASATCWFKPLAAVGVDYHGPVEHDGGDRSVYFEDPEGNVVEAWDFFEHSDGARDGVEALT
jgi:catechol-2,3-dioxygenase